jgi:diguanylate cyclase (GGDEF)-like protein
MKFRTSFRSKLMLLTIVPLAVAQIVTLFAVMKTVEKDVDTRARESLIVGSTVVSEFLASRGEQLRTSVAVLASDFGLKEATATGDAATIRSVLENHSRRIRADMAMLVDLNGNTVASTLAGAANRSPGDLAFSYDDDEQNIETTATFGDSAFHVFLVPLRAPVTIGWVVLGFRIDEQLEGRLTSLTGLDVSIVASESTPVAGLLANEKTLTYSLPFVSGSSDFSVLLERSLDEAMLPYVEARRGLLIFAGTLLLFVALAGVMFSTTIAKPLRTLASAAQRIISGNYEGELGVASDDEFGELASSFDSMRHAIAEREQRISHQALHDSLTDLPNRYKVLQILTTAIESARDDQRSVAVLSIRLSRMGEISSTLGHMATDQLIIQAARHLRVNLDKDDFLGHTGTNEFVLVLPGQDATSAQSRVERIEQILSSGVTLENIDVALQTEIGIAEFPKHSDAAAELLRYASIARTEAETGKERVRVYEAGREDEFVRRLRVVSDLRTAIREEHIEVWYQPKVCLKEGGVCGAEALVRWHHPELGLLFPDEFIPAAEQAGSIVHLTRYVLTKAVEQCREWADKGFDLHMSVNLSVRDLLDEYLPYHVLQILKENGIKPEQLTLEVTESSIMEDVARAILVLECLREIGVRISMDDFGTGHSSLAQLRNIPLHELKIDKSFVMSILDDAQNEAIVRTTIDLAHSLKLEVVAEGVEDEATMRRIASLGCEQAQGYFLSKPVPASEFIVWLDEFKPIVFHERRKTDRAFVSQSG